MRPVEIEASHENAVATAILGICKAKDWIQMPAIMIDLNEALAAVGPEVKIGCVDAALAARELMDEVGAAAGWKQPELSKTDELVLKSVFKLAYDELVKTIKEQP